MKLADESVETVIRVLDKCSSELEPVGPWRWQCVVQNGTRMPLAASVEDGFLQLVGRPQANRGTSGSIETGPAGKRQAGGRRQIRAQRRKQRSPLAHRDCARQ